MPAGRVGEGQLHSGLLQVVLQSAIAGQTGLILFPAIEQRCPDVGHLLGIPLGDGAQIEETGEGDAGGKPRS